METQFVPHVADLGQPFEGGFFGGLINVNGSHKGIIVSPKAQGDFGGCILLPEYKLVEGAFNPADCVANTHALAEAGSEIAQQVLALDINGHKDWVIPSRDVLEVVYRNLKPGTDKNWAGGRDGDNPNSVPPNLRYTPEYPAQTAVELFQTGGTEALEESWYWASTVCANGRSAFIQGFASGNQSWDFLAITNRVRAVRLIQL